MTIVRDSFVFRIINFEEIIIDLLKNFRTIIHKDNKPNREKDVQNLLNLFFDVREYNFLKEKERVSYCGKNYIPDFTHPILNMAIEVKFYSSGNINTIRKELASIIGAYSQKWKKMLFIVYDKRGNIRNIKSFTKEFQRDDDLKIRCIVIKE